MTDRDVYLDDMGFLIDTAVLDRVLAGEALLSDASIARFVDDLRDEFPPAEVPIELEDRHVMAIMAVASEPPLVAVAAPPSRLDRLRSSLAARAAALSLAGGSAFTGAAYAGVLPDAVQGVVSDTAADLGVDLPHPDDGPSGRDLPQGEGLAEDREGEAGPDDGRSGDPDGAEAAADAGDPRVGRSDRAGGTAPDDEDSRDGGSDDEAEEPADRERSDTEEDSDDRADADDSDSDERDGSRDDDDEASDEASDEAEDALDDAEDHEPSEDAEDAVSERDGSDEVDLEVDEDEESSDLDD